MTTCGKDSFPKWPISEVTFLPELVSKLANFQSARFLSDRFSKWSISKWFISRNDHLKELLFSKVAMNRFFRTFESGIFQTPDQTILLKLVSSLTSNDFNNCKINSKFYTLHTPSFSKNGQIFTILTLNQKCLFTWNVKIGGSNVFFSDLDNFKSLHFFSVFYEKWGNVSE